MAIEAEGREITPYASRSTSKIARSHALVDPAAGSGSDRGDPDPLDRGITIASMALAARRTERQIVERLSGVVDALGGSNFPLTDGILARMHSLSEPGSLRMVPRANRSRPVIRA